MKSYLLQTLVFILLSQGVALVLNLFWMNEPLPDMMVEALIAGAISSIVSITFLRFYRRKYGEPENNHFIRQAARVPGAAERIPQNHE